MKPLRAARVAISFLTILPIPAPAGMESRDLTRSAAFFPLVGWILGGLLLLVAQGLIAMFGSGLTTALLLVAVLAWLTRGLHLDGLADLLDGLGGGSEPARRLAIMKDSGIGAFGVIGLILLLGLKASAVADLLPELFADNKMLLIMPLVAGRWAMVLLAWRGCYPREQGTGHAFVGQVGLAEVVVSSLFVVPLCLLGPAAILVLVASLLPAFFLYFKATRALGGITGDVLGASCELGETLGWLALLAW
ncbi:MAG: adenosylcobinamide-GDP ribazoletransferase [Thermodesulfobacteriota bacterium]